MTHRPNTLVTLLRRLLAPLAVAAMLLGLAGNANAQLAFPTGSGIGVFPNFALTLIYPSGVAITPTTFPAATGGTGAVTYALPDPAGRPDLQPEHPRPHRHAGRADLKLWLRLCGDRLRHPARPRDNNRVHRHLRHRRRPRR